ncbi:MAG: PAQR family membrane homeostasis protein TrhA [Acidobacteriota bacterium]
MKAIQHKNTNMHADGACSSFSNKKTFLRSFWETYGKVRNARRFSQNKLDRNVAPYTTPQGKGVGNEMLPSHERPQSFEEEIANGVSHGMALVACLIATPILLSSAWRVGDPWSVAGAGVFSGTTIFMYLSSTLYHFLPANGAKHVFRLLDHGAIFLLIAGTYTPFTLGPLRGAWGWTLFGMVWSMAIVGLVLKGMGVMRHPRLSTGLYLAMGWLILIAIQPLSLKVPPPGLLWLLAGGIAYTGGVAFYAAERVRYSHFVWHLFVVLGNTCHFFAVLWYAV